MPNMPADGDWALDWELNERVSLSAPASDEPVPGTPVQRRWKLARARLERTNEALAERLSLLRELDRKILAHRERTRREAGQRRRRARWRPAQPRQACTLLRASATEAPTDSAPRSSLPRELDQAIDLSDQANQEEEEEEEEGNTTSVAPSGLDSSWDSGVGAEVSGPGSGRGLRGAGWLRVHTGEQSSLVYLTLETSAADVCRDMLLSENLALYVQYNGELGRRLSSNELPLELQEQLLLQLGYREPSRRARLGLDAELRHLIGFHVGPAAPLDELRGYSRCGYALVLKGLVFPQWKKRALAVIGSRLFLYPACSESRPEWMELAGGGAVCCAPSRLGKLVLRVTGLPARTNAGPSGSGAGNGSNDRLRHRETRHLYLGFQHPWDRDLWRCWLKRACQSAASPEASQTLGKLDMSETGVARLPEAVRAYSAVREFFLGHNQLAPIDGNLKLLLSFPNLQELHLENNRLDELPGELLSLKNLTFLDLSDNQIQRLPPEISSLTSLRELILDRNDIKELPKEIGELRQLRHISLAGNLIETPAACLLEMRALALGQDVLSGRATETSAAKASSEEKSHLHNSLYKVNLRNNQLKGNIILGNYGNLTHLDLSENSIEKLDLSALQELRSVRCARNMLTELTLCGRSLVSLIAGNNKLKKLTIVPVPVNLEHLDVSYNELDNLPDWSPELPVLRALFASHNRLTALPDRLLSQPAASRLEVLHLPHNRLQALPPPRHQLALVHLTLQDNALTALPPNFFANTRKMKVLNLSNNRLSELPVAGGGGGKGNSYDFAAETEETAAARSSNNSRQGGSNGNASSLEKLYLTGNCLTNTALDALAKFGALRVLHLAYNALDTLPESCIASWKELEELVLSGNKLQYLPDNVANLAHLRVLRVHSNRLLTCPAFNKTSSLKVLDLAHNQLDRLNLDSLLSAQLQFLDISCNSRLQVDPRQFQSYHSNRRPVSLVDVSGQSKSAAVAAATKQSEQQQQQQQQRQHQHQQYHHLPWRLGFSETAGNRERLLVSQLRMPEFCETEGLFGLFDGGSSQEAPSQLQEMLPRLLLEERAAKESSPAGEYLRYALLSAQRELRQAGAQKYGLDAALLHLRRQASGPGGYLLTAATCGEARAVLCRASGPLQLAQGPPLPPAHYLPRLQAALARQQPRGPGALPGPALPLALTEPTSQEVILEEDDELLIVANRRLWEVLSIQEAVREARAEANPVLAAKRLQDLGQAYGAEDNLSVIVVRLSMATAAAAAAAGASGAAASAEPLGRLLMRELRQAVHSKAAGARQSCGCPCCAPRTSGHEPPAACCCHAPPLEDGFYLNAVLRNVASTRSSGKSVRSSQRQSQHQQQQQQQQREDRSSPSGQSDQTSEVGMFEPRSRRRASGRGGGSSRFCAASANKIRQQQQQQQQQQQHSERTPPPSDEQLRCWEYMLEQNTQLLFDKELDTLSSVPRSNALRRGGQSRSTPQLGSSASVPFLSRRFGSARSFDTSSVTTYPHQHQHQHQHQQYQHQHQQQQQQPQSAVAVPVPVLRSSGFGGSGRRLLNGGPNAAYFGSLQRLMPYNLEYDFAVIQERGALDSLEQDASRMQQYWGVATTEL